MAVNVLQYALGLSTAGFLPGVRGAVAGIAGITAAAIGAEGVLSRVFNQIDRGGKAKDLSNRLGIDVGPIIQAQRAFAAVGVGAEGATGLLSVFQKTLGGTTETGEKSRDIFERMGLSLDAIKGQDLAGQLDTVFAGLRQLNPEAAQFAAAKIFGRNGGGDALQAARNVGEFGKAWKRANNEAQLMARNAGAFNDLGNAATEIRRKFDEAFLHLAAASAPVLQGVANLITALPIEEMGKRFGAEMAALGESFLQGRFGEVFSLSLQAGVQDAANLMLSKIAEWGDAWRGEMNADGSKKPGFWSKFGAGAAGVGQGLFGIGGEVGGILGIPGAEDFANREIDKAQANFDFAGIGDGVLNRVADVFVAGVEGRKNEHAEKLAKIWEELGEAAKQRAEANAARNPAPPKGGNDLLPGKDEKAKNGAVGRSASFNGGDALTRIGGFSSFGGDPSGAALNSIKETSKQSAQQLRNLNAFVMRKPRQFDDGFVNQ